MVVTLVVKGLKSANIAEVYSGPCQTTKMELFAKIVNDVKPLTFFEKNVFRPYFTNVLTIFHFRCLTGF